MCARVYACELIYVQMSEDNFCEVSSLLPLCGFWGIKLRSARQRGKNLYPMNYFTDPK